MKYKKVIVTGWIVMVIISYLFKPHSNPPLPLPSSIIVGWIVLMGITIVFIYNLFKMK
ncbi:MAG: hypothetical protein PEPC_01936 [Peptostreptococcus russellii]